MRIGVPTRSMKSTYVGDHRIRPSLEWNVSSGDEPDVSTPPMVLIAIGLVATVEPSDVSLSLTLSMAIGILVSSKWKRLKI